MNRNIHYIYIIALLLLLGAATPAFAQTIKGNVYGGGNLAQVVGSTTVNVIDGTVSDQNVDDGNVYGGGYGASAILTGNTTINISGGTISQDVYGGGALANVTGSTEVNIDGGTVTQDVYGGGALANVGVNTVVNLTGGSIRSSYGGGLGSNEVAALIGGDATTTLNGTVVNGSVFGCNNLNGTPQGHAKVHVLSTAERDGQSAEDYDVAAVYGGGNLAAYVPSDATLANAEKNFAEVLIENCDNSIAYVYGGGNAAPVPATKVTIKGADAIDNAFAGGNGAGADNPGADIGYKGFFSKGAATEYGTGIATINVQGGTIHHVYGGSNTLGYIKDHAEVNVEADGTCTMDVAELYGGGKMAPGKAATINIACTGEGKIDNVYGGAHMADLTGDITLNIRGGQIGNVFGGNNVSGTINGAITVNVNWATGPEACGTNSLDNVYGGGNLAAYTTPLGKTHPTITLTNGTVNHNIFGGGLGATAVMTGNPVVNINGGAVGGSVYGGGEQADVVGSTYVTINDGRLGADIFGGGQGSLNGDGSVRESADVSGTTHVTINGGEFAVEYNGLNFNKHYNIYGGGNIASQVGETHVYVTKGMVSNTSDGSTKFLDNSRFDRNEAGMAQAYYHEGQMYFCIFGGGYGKKTSVTGDTWVDFNISGMTDINSTAIEDDLLEYQSYLDVIGGGFNGTVGGNTNVHVGGNAMCRNVYGGGLYATIGTPDDADKGKTNVHITGGNIDNVYGGGVMGDIMTSTNVNIGLASALDFDGRNYAVANDKVTILMSVYGANDVSGHVPQANINHNGGTIDQNIYGAGNGDYRGYYTPGVCDYAEGENDNYFPVDHSGDTSKDGKSTKGPKGNTYKGRPQTENVSITMGGNSDSDRAVVLGQVFGGGNSCTVGHWKTDLSSKYGGDPHQWRNDPDFFEGGGQLNITLNSHVKIGYDNTTLAGASDDIKDMYTRDGENVSGLFMGCSGDVLATQSTAEDDYDYHHYYDSYTAKYWPGFAVFDNSGTPLSREEGLKSFKAYLNNIMVWSNDVNLNITGSDIWLANFVGGGFRGSMKRKDGNAYQWTLPAGVTVGNCIVGGAYNTDVVYRVFDTENDMHTYKTQDGHYLYRTVLKPEWNEGEDYHHLEKDAGGNTTAIVRYYFDGGILSSDGSTTKDITKLTLANAMDASDTSKRRIFAGCFTSGTTEGNTVIDYTGTGSPRVHGGGAYAHVAGDATVNIKGGVAGDVYGGGSLADVKGSTFVNLTGGTITSAYGGGLGDATTSALVYGDATTTLNGSVVNGSIFGANNVNGTPLGHVMVHVLKTMSRGQANPNVTGNENNFDVKAVYGGGNQAAYVPTGSIGEANSLTDKTKYAEVLIENCDNSIAYVYGGGNAAPVPATKVTIYGANAIDYAFAGGNGKGVGNKGADIGYLGFFSETGESTPKYGTGETDIKIYGGTINNVYGGSNTLGYIREHAYVEVLNAPDDYEGTICELNLGDVHAGGNQAEMYCGGSVTLSCSEGADVVYAGANEADIHGDIDLTITSGTYGKVFGGNNQRGNVYGGITINIDETGCWPVMIGELYACGNEAPYSVYGYDGGGNVLTEGEPQYDDPVINLISFTRIGKIFGGGYAAAVYGSPTINVEPIPGIFATGEPQPNYILNGSDERIENTGNLSVADALGAAKIGSIGTIYGGGDKGAVYGNTKVQIGTKTQNQHISGADTTTLHDVAVTITGDVFGGGNEAIVSGDTNVKIGEDPLNLP